MAKTRGNERSKGRCGEGEGAITKVCEEINSRVFLPGGNPYPGVEINEKFISLLKSGYRMDKPKFASDEV